MSNKSRPPQFETLKVIMNCRIFFLLVFFSNTVFCLEPKESLSAQELYGRADAICVVRLTGGDYERGIGDGYYLRAEVLSVLKGNALKNIGFDDGYDYSEPCFKRTLASFYVVFLEKSGNSFTNSSHGAIWATGSAFEVEGGPRHWFGRERSDTEISKYLEKNESEKAYFSTGHVW